MRKRTGIGGTEAFRIFSDKYGNDSEAVGNGSFADYPWYGTDKFFFIEDNTIEFGAATDTSYGTRFVYRHNYNINAVVTDHGTEALTVAASAPKRFTTIPFTGLNQILVLQVDNAAEHLSGMTTTLPGMQT
jgi:hypothetical protein